MFFSFYGQKTTKLGLKILAWFSKRASARKILKSLAPTRGIYCHKVYQLIPKLSEGYINPKGQNLISKNKKKKTTQNFAFLDPQGYLVTLRPNASTDLPKILHASPNMLGAYLSQISAY